MDFLFHFSNQCYEVLGIEQTADRTEIRRAYSRLAKIHRPDTEPEKFQELRQAYETALARLEQTQEILPIAAPLEKLDEHRVEPTQETLLSSNLSENNSELRSSMEALKHRLIEHLSNNDRDDVVISAAKDLVRHEALFNIELRLQTEQWLIQLGAYDQRVKTPVILWIAEQFELLENSESFNLAPEKASLLKRLSIAQSLAHIQNIANTDKASVENIVLKGAGYVRLLTQVFQLKEPKARYRIDGVVNWIRNQPYLDESMVDASTLARWESLRWIPTIGPLLLTVYVGLVLTSLLILMPLLPVDSRLVAFVLSIVVSAPVLAATVHFSNTLIVKRVRRRIGHTNSAKFRTFEKTIALLSLASLPLFKHFPNEVSYLGGVLLLLTLLQISVTGLIADHAEIKFKQLGALFLGFAVLTWVGYVGMGGFTGTNEGISFSGALPSLLSSGMALYYRYWPAAWRTTNPDVNPLKHWSVLLSLNLGLIFASLAATQGNLAVLTSMASLCVLYWSISVIGIRAIQENNAVTFYFLLLCLGASLMGIESLGILAGPLAVSIIGATMMANAIWKDYARSWLVSKGWLKQKQLAIPKYIGLKPETKRLGGLHWFWWLIIVSTAVRMLAAIAQS
jgi:DnaJ domain